MVGFQGAEGSFLIHPWVIRTPVDGLVKVFGIPAVAPRSFQGIWVRFSGRPHGALSLLRLGNGIPAAFRLLRPHLINKRKLIRGNEGLCVDFKRIGGICRTVEILGVVPCLVVSGKALESEAPFERV